MGAKKLPIWESCSPYWGGAGIFLGAAQFPFPSFFFFFSAFLPSVCFWVLLREIFGKKGLNDFFFFAGAIKLFWGPKIFFQGFFLQGGCGGEKLNLQFFGFIKKPFSNKMGSHPHWALFIGRGAFRKKTNRYFNQVKSKRFFWQTAKNNFKKKLTFLKKNPPPLVFCPFFGLEGNWGQFFFPHRANKTFFAFCFFYQIFLGRFTKI